MTVDVYTQHLPCISPVVPPTSASSLAALLWHCNHHGGKAHLFFIYFHGWMWIEGENKNTFNIQARQRHAT